MEEQQKYVNKCRHEGHIPSLEYLKHLLDGCDIKYKELQKQLNEKRGIYGY